MGAPRSGSLFARGFGLFVDVNLVGYYMWGSTSSLPQRVALGEVPSDRALGAYTLASLWVADSVWGEAQLTGALTFLTLRFSL